MKDTIDEIAFALTLADPTRGENLTSAEQALDIIEGRGALTPGQTAYLKGVRGIMNLWHGRIADAKQLLSEASEMAQGEDLQLRRWLHDWLRLAELSTRSISA